MRRRVLFLFTISLVLGFFLHGGCLPGNQAEEPLPPPEIEPDPSSTLPTPILTQTQVNPTLQSAKPSPTKPTLVPTPEPKQPPHVILMVVDSLRADHISAYGYTRETTPNLDRLIAAHGSRFSQAISPAAWTCPANAALLSGYSPTSLGSTWTTMERALPDQVDTLAEQLKTAGYLTAGFVNNSCLKGRFGFSQGFEFYDESTLGQAGIDSSNKSRANEVHKRLEDWLDSVGLPAAGGGQPLFMFIYYMEPHVWYDPPPPYDRLFDPDYDGPLTPASFGIGEDVVSGRFVPSKRDIEHLIALYDGEIASWDAYLGELLTVLEKRRLLQDSLLVLTADHGEMFGEHGKWLHGSSLYEESIRVPLLMRYPGEIEAGQVIETPVMSMDLMPTILELAGATIPPGLQASSLLPLLRGRSPDVARPVFSELDGITDPRHWAFWLAPNVDIRSVRVGDWKLISSLTGDFSGELYRLSGSTPYEGKNQIAQEQGRAAALHKELALWFGH